MVFLFDEFVDDATFVLGLRMVDFADKFPDFTTQALTVDSVEPFVEALTDANMAQMVDL